MPSDGHYNTLQQLKISVREIKIKMGFTPLKLCLWTNGSDKRIAL